MSATNVAYARWDASRLISICFSHESISFIQNTLSLWSRCITSDGIWPKNAGRRLCWMKVAETPMVGYEATSFKFFVRPRFSMMTCSRCYLRYSILSYAMQRIKKTNGNKVCSHLNDMGETGHQLQTRPKQSWKSSEYKMLSTSIASLSQMCWKTRNSIHQGVWCDSFHSVQHLFQSREDQLTF